MKTRRLWWLMGALLAAGGCATTPSVPNPIVSGRTQALAVRSDPAGAACTIMQRGEVVATVEVTPGVAEVPRDFKSSFFEGNRLEGKPPLEIVCRKDGYLEYRRQFPVDYAYWVLQTESALKPRPEPTPAEAAKDAASAVAGAAGAAAFLAAPAISRPLGMALVAGGGAVVAPVAAIAVIGIMAIHDRPRVENYAYQPLPELLLVPAQFESAAAYDTFFADFEAKIRSAHERARADRRQLPVPALRAHGRAAVPGPLVPTLSRAGARGPAGRTRPHPRGARAGPDRGGRGVT